MAETVARSAREADLDRPASDLRMFLPVPVVCFIGALLTDLAYLKSGGNLHLARFLELAARSPGWCSAPLPRSSC